ncbi:FAD-binding protein [Kribbella sp. DT2]|uniref:FAD-binding oxidoreductase n=1 Tax=Kribbella sp. DT2 TaxID=3393427 RepID=UPI003CF1017B
MNPDEGLVALSGWGRTAHRKAVVRRPSSDNDLVGLVQATSRLTVRGAGKSYGDAALPEHGTVLDMTAHNRILSFDQGKGILVVEAGATLNAVLAQTLPLGWVLPVLPGTAHITVGGAIASDVHGKNHPGAGSFGQHVLWMSLLRSDGSIHRLSAGQDSDGFWGTIGGMGLTGVILQAAIQLQQVDTGWASRRRRRTGSLKETLGVLRELAAEQELDPELHVVAWLDAHQAGRGVVDECRPARYRDLPRAVPPFPEQRGGSVRRSIRSLPGPGVMVRPAIAAASSARWKLSPAKERQLLPLTTALCPLDRAGSWPAAFGRAGLVQYQFAVPVEASDVLGQVLRLLVERRTTPALTTVKNLGYGTAGPLSFPIPGWTMAVDLPARRLGDGTMLRSVGDLVAGAGGRVYLAKDVVTDPALIPAMYPRLETWRRTQRRLDPDGRLTSALAQRLELLS